MSTRAERRGSRQRRTRGDSKFTWREDDPSGGEPTALGIFSQLTQLPEDVQRRLDEKQQRRWMRLANRTYVAATGDHQTRRTEAIREANAKVG